MADSTIGSLPAASEITANDLFVLEQNGEAKKLLGSILTEFLNRDILNVTVTSVDATSNPTYSYDSTTGTLEIGLPRGCGISDVSKTSTSGLVDTYTITLDQLPSQSIPTTFTFTITNAKAITNIQALSASHTPGSLDTYAINFNDGTSTTFSVYNGANGTNGVSIASISKVSGTGAGGTIDTYEVILSTGNVGGTFYVYNGADGQGAPGSLTPNVDSGDGDVGTATAYAREDHVHPTDTTRQPSNLYFTNAVANNWSQESTPTYADFEYRCAITLTGVTNLMYADVIFAPDEAMSGNYAPVCQTYNGGVYIYSKVNTTVTIPTIIVFK